ncbi:MAG TPA: hypothetical protein VJ913_02980 [Actinomycetota bacterium]|nr:hypothetical protein [Actinomycetota bacterium]
MVDVSARGQVGERAVVPLLCVTAALAIGASTWALLVREPVAAGWAALVAGIALVVGGVLLRPADRLGRVLLSFADRLFDGCVLGALAWVTRTVDPGVAAGALVALAAGFLASYIRARGGSLGYGIEEGIVTPALRYGLVGLGLVGGWPWTAWVVAVLMLLACGVRASQVFKEERG